MKFPRKRTDEKKLEELVTKAEDFLKQKKEEAIGSENLNEQEIEFMQTLEEIERYNHDTAQNYAEQYNELVREKDRTEYPPVEGYEEN